MQWWVKPARSSPWVRRDVPHSIGRVTTASSTSARAVLGREPSFPAGTNGGVELLDRKAGARVEESFQRRRLGCSQLEATHASRASRTYRERRRQPEVDAVRGGGKLAAATRPPNEGRRLGVDDQEHPARRSARASGARLPRVPTGSATARSEGRRTPRPPRNGRSGASPLLPQEPAGNAKRVGQRRPTGERGRREPLAARTRLEVGRSATVASATPLRKATRRTRSPRVVASSSRAKTRPFTCSTRRSAWSE